MKNTINNKLAVISVAGVIGCSQAQAAGDFEAGIGYMDRSERAYGFIKAQGVVYQGNTVSHKLGLEYLGYQETLDSFLGTDITYSTLAVNYEVEFQMNETFSVFGGAGAGGQRAALDSPVGELDDDLNGYAQVFVGARARITQNLDVRLGVRKMFFQDFELLGVSGLEQEGTLGFDLGFTLRF